MPPSAYLPDPGKWIKPGAGAATPLTAPKPQQRPLAPFNSAFPTPPTSNSRHRSSSRPTNENAPKLAPGPSRLRDGSLTSGSVSGWIVTPPNTASQPRRRVDDLKRTKAENAKGRGSPISRSSAAQSSRVTARPLGSRLAIKEDWKSEEEDDDEIEVYEEAPLPRSSKSKPRPRKESLERRLEKPTPVIPESRRLKYAFSSGDLSDLPPGYGDDDPDTQCDDSGDDPVVVSTSPPRASTPAPPSPEVSNPNPYAHLGMPTTQSDHLEDSQPNLTPRILTQPTTQALALLWKLNGHDTDRIKKGEEPWGKSAGRIENDARIRERAEAEKKERLRVERVVQAQGLEKSAESARVVLDEMLDDVSHKAKEMRESLVREGEDGEEPVPRAKSGYRSPLASVGMNTGRRIRRRSSTSPSPRKDGKRRMIFDDSRDKEGHTAFRRRGRSLSASLTRSDELDDLLDPIVEEAKRDALERDERTRLHHTIPPAVEAKTGHHHSPAHDPEPHASPHYTVTPSKRKRRSERDADLRSLSPPPRPIFSSPYRKGQATSKAYKPVDVEETLMTWSQLAPPEESVTGAGDDDVEAGVGGAVEAPKASADEGRGGESSPIVALRPAEETQSIPNTEFTQSYPKFFPSQTVPNPKRPIPPSDTSKFRTESNWESIQRGGLFNVPSVAAQPQIASGSGTKRKARVSTGKAAPTSGKQSKLEMFGIAKERPVKRMRGFENDFKDEPEIVEDDVDVGGESSRPTGRAGFQAVPEAPYHPELRPAGIKAVKAREAVVSSAPRARPHTRAQTRSSDRSSPPPEPLRAPNQQRSSPSGRSPDPSSLLTDSTEEETPPALRGWYVDMEKRGGGRGGSAA